MFSCMHTIIDQLILAMYLIKFSVYFCSSVLYCFLFFCPIANKKKKKENLNLEILKNYITLALMQHAI